MRRMLLLGAYHIMMSFLTAVGTVAGVILFMALAAKLATRYLFALDPMLQRDPVVERALDRVVDEGEWQSGSVEDFLDTAEEEVRIEVAEVWGLTKEDFERIEATVDSMELDPVFPPADDLLDGFEPDDCPDCYDCDCHGEDLPPKAPETWIPQDWFEPLMLLMQKHSDHALGRLDILEYRDRTCRIVDGRGKAGSWEEMEQILNRLREMRIPHAVMCYPANDIGRPVEVIKWVPERL